MSDILRVFSHNTPHVNIQGTENETYDSYKNVYINVYFKHSYLLLTTYETTSAFHFCREIICFPSAPLSPQASELLSVLKLRQRQFASAADGDPPHSFADVDTS